jgi:YggT family protein
VVTTSVSPVVNVVDTFAWILTILIIVRIALSWIGGVGQNNPLVQVVTGIVDPLLRPFRRILPAFGGIDFSPLLALVVIQVVQSVVDNVVISQGQVSIAQIIFAVVTELFLQIDLFICIIIGIHLLLRLLQSSPFHPANMFMRQITDPFVRPFRFAGKGLPAIVIGLLFYVALYVVIYNVRVNVHL